MESTVTISLKDYEDLKVYKSAIDNGRIVLANYGYFCSYHILEIEKEEVIKDLVSQIDSLKDKLHDERMNRKRWYQF